MEQLDRLLRYYTMITTKGQSYEFRTSSRRVSYLADEGGERQICCRVVTRVAVT